MGFLIQRSSRSLDPTAVSAPRDFATRDLEHPTLGLLPCEPPSSRDPLISATCPPRWTVLILSRLRHSRSRKASLYDSRCPNPRYGRSRDTRPLSDEWLRFPRDFATREVKMLTSVSPGARISEMDDSSTRVLPQTLRFFHSFTISDVECPDSRPPDSRTSERRYPDTTPSGLSLCCSSREVLNLVQLSTDPMVVGYLDQDLTAQTCPALYTLPLLPGRGKTNGPDTPTDLGDLRSRFLRYSRR
jgi:hypothetical protein